MRTLTGPDDPPLRRFRLEHAFDGEYEDEFLASTEERTNEEWYHVPLLARTQHLQTTAFCSLSRGMCRVTQLKRLHANYPFKLLATPWKKHLVAEVQADSECWRRLDVFVRLLCVA